MARGEAFAAADGTLSEEVRVCYKRRGRGWMANTAGQGLALVGGCGQHHRPRICRTATVRSASFILRLTSVCIACDARSFCSGPFLFVWGMGAATKSSVHPLVLAMYVPERVGAHGACGVVNVGLCAACGGRTAGRRRLLLCLC